MNRTLISTLSSFFLNLHQRLLDYAPTEVDRERPHHATVHRQVQTKPTEATLRRKSQPPGVSVSWVSAPRKTNLQPDPSDPVPEDPLPFTLSFRDLTPDFSPLARDAYAEAVSKYAERLAQRARSEAQHPEGVVREDVVVAIKSLGELRKPGLVIIFACTLGGIFFTFGADKFVNVLPTLPNRASLAAYVISAIVGVALMVFNAKRR